MQMNEYFHAADRVGLFSKHYLAKMGWHQSLNGIPHDNDGLAQLAQNRL